MQKITDLINRFSKNKLIRVINKNPLLVGLIILILTLVFNFFMQQKTPSTSTPNSDNGVLINIFIIN